MFFYSLVGAAISGSVDAWCCGVVLEKGSFFVRRLHEDAAALNALSRRRVAIEIYSRKWRVDATRARR